jgi:hypothetical protein
MNRYGLRINALASKTKPCGSARNDFNKGENTDPTELNPPF